MKTKIDFDSYINAVESIKNVCSLEHKDAFRLVNSEEKTICYFHIRKYSVDIYVHDTMTSLFKNYELKDCSSKNYHKIMIESESELFENLTKINTEYAKREAKKKSKKTDTTKK